MIMVGCVKRNPVYGWEDFASSRNQTRDPGFSLTPYLEYFTPIFGLGWMDGWMDV